MTTITLVNSLWRHNDNCCYANMRSQGQASCLLTLEFKCHLRYCSSQEVDVSLSHSAVLHYIIWTNAEILSFGPLGTNFCEILIKIQKFSFMKRHLKISSAKWQPFCPGGKWVEYNLQSGWAFFPSLFLWHLTLLMLETEYSGFGINTLPLDALAPKVTRASPGVLLAV